MTPNNLQKVRSCLAGLDAVLARSRGGRTDEESLLEFRRLCWSAMLLTGDGECHEQIDVLVQSAKELYADCGDSQVDELRGRIRTVLSAFRARLNGMGSIYGKRWRDLRAA
jgi:hypothetical protein